jgi:hypothetical protein
MENWKMVEGFEAYEVSDLGRVRRRLPGGHNTKVGRIITPAMNTRYPTVGLYKNAKRRTVHVHKLVAKAFVPNPLNLPEVNHLGKKSDNRATKLEWRTQAGNTLHAVQNSLRGTGIWFDKETGKYRAHYSPGGKLKTLGSFSTKEAALQARAEAVNSLPHTT